MFGTFTGNSKRPRNVNLSGQASNPFANTSWSPSAVSSTSKTISEAQADRERRQAERQRVKAANKIQNTWRGHRARRILGDERRAAFDKLYASLSSTASVERIPPAFNLISAFFTIRRFDDIKRVLLYVGDTESVDNPQHIYPSSISTARLQRFTDILVKSLDVSISQSAIPIEASRLLHLIDRLAKRSPLAISKSIEQYYGILAKICVKTNGAVLLDLLKSCICTPLQVNERDTRTRYQAFAFYFLSNGRLTLFEDHIDSFAANINVEHLSKALLASYSSSQQEHSSREGRLWLLAHFVDLSRAHSGAHSKLEILQSLLFQLSTLSADISLRFDIHQLQPEDESLDDNAAQPLDPYISRQLSILVDHDGISNLLHDFSGSLAQASGKESQGPSLLAGYILTLLQCFPSKADDTRMRLFLESIPTPNGHIPTVKFLWQTMSKTSVFLKLLTESVNPVIVLQNYIQSTSRLLNDSTDDQEWRIILLFLELYQFILRLSDDEDFFSGIYPQFMEPNPTTVSRTRSCSLSSEDVQVLSTFLKNTAFCLHYKSQEISQNGRKEETNANMRIGSYLGADETTTRPDVTNQTFSPTKMSLDSLRTIVTTTMKMIYERDSRKQFLPLGHWLMTEKLRQESFVTAVIAEEERQNEEEEQEDESEDEDLTSTSYSPLGVHTGVYSTFAGQRVSRHVRMERLKAQQMRSQRERRLAEMGPKLEILKHMPFVVPFETRVVIFRQFINLDTARREGDNPFPTHPFARHHARIRRGQLFEDAFQSFYGLGEGFKDAIQITFVDQFGAQEAGIDGGGVTKEFLTRVTSEAFGNDNDGLGLFTSNEQGLLYPDPTSLDRLREEMRQNGLDESHYEDWNGEISEMLKRCEFLGRVVGKCMYESILVDLAFAGFFLLKWPSPGPKEENSYKGSVNDLRDMDEELYKGMLRLKNYSGDVSELGFDFTITDQISPPGAPVKTITRKLMPNGDEIPVTNDNRLLYISYVARHRLVVQPLAQTAAFLRGLRAIIRPSWLSMFNQSELQRLVGGDSSEIDIEDLRRNTVYSGLYEIGDDQQEHPTIKLFWKVMREFTDAQRRDVLKYVSSTPRAPLLGFSQLMPKFSIRDSGSDEDRLPSTSTCVNLLKLPKYTRESTLREKLLYAVSSGAGFDLS